ncbi:cytochrome B [Rubrolithibacter danxiaensis]|uniref:cytochrome B n=1 Tax=Rubrolithibacter danxiaensis TaxID=3390805 RepID=UPI003BF8E1D5
MYKILLEAHSGLRFVVLLLLVLSIVTAFVGWFGNKNYSGGNKKLYLFTLIFTHIQLLIGLFLYFVSPFAKPGEMGTAMKDDTFRYWTVEHGVLMIIAIVLITMGYSKSKKLLSDTAKHKTVAIFYTLAVLIIVIAIVLSGRPLLGMSR